MVASERAWRSATLMARKKQPVAPEAPPEPMSRTEWAFAFERKVDELRPPDGPQVPGDDRRHAVAEAPGRRPRARCRSVGGRARGTLAMLRIGYFFRF